MIEYSYWIALEQTPGIGPAEMERIHRTLADTGLAIRDLCDCTVDEILAEFSLPEDTARAVASAADILDSIEEIYHDILQAGIRPLLFFEDHFPRELIHAMPSEYPAILYCIGNTSVLNERSAAIFSSSEISTKAESICYQASRVCTEHHVPVNGSLNKNAGTLIAAGAMENGGIFTGVIPCGMLQFSMSERLTALFNPDLHCLASPFFPQTAVTKENAVYRNKILAALSRASYVVEMNETDEVLENTASFISLADRPLYATEYAEYPGQALGNRRLFDNYGARPVRGRKNGNTLVPNLDAFIAHMKFDV